jgi:hypothetical protein
VNPIEMETNVSTGPDSPGMMWLRRFLAVILGVLGSPFLLAFVLGILACAQGDFQPVPTLAGGAIASVSLLLAYLLWGGPELPWMQRAAVVWLPRTLAVILSAFGLLFLLAFLLGVVEMGRGGPIHLFIPVCGVLATFLHFMSHSLWTGAGIPLWIRRAIVVAMLSGQTLYFLFDLTGWLQGRKVDWFLLLAVHLLSLWCSDVYFALWTRIPSGSPAADGHTATGVESERGPG